MVVLRVILVVTVGIVVDKVVVLVVVVNHEQNMFTMTILKDKKVNN